MNYIEHKERVVDTNEKFKHVMAITLDPRTKYTDGVIRCITSRSGDVVIKGYTDRSKLYRIKGASLFKYELLEEIKIKNQETVIKELEGKEEDCIGLEDPDIWIDEKNDLLHLYFTIPIKYSPGWKKMHIHLGHAVGKDLDTLEMTPPVLLGDDMISAKEVSIAPINTKGFRYNLVESKDRRGKQSYSTVRVAVAQDMGKPWQYGETAFHPAENDIS